MAGKKTANLISRQTLRYATLYGEITNKNAYVHVQRAIRAAPMWTRKQRDVVCDYYGLGWVEHKRRQNDS